MIFGTNEIDRFLLENHIVGIDSNVLIALIETNANYSASAKQLFRQIKKHNNQVWFSAITIPEVMKKPLETKKQTIIKKYEELFIPRWRIPRGLLRRILY